MAYDSSRGRTVLFGGLGGAGAAKRCRWAAESSSCNDFTSRDTTISAAMVAPIQSQRLGSRARPIGAGSGFLRSGALERVPCLLICPIEGLAGLRQGRAQRRPRLASRLLQLLQTRFGLGRICLHLLDGGIDIGALCGCHFRCFLMELVGRLAPSLDLSGGNIPECGLLLF